MSDSEHVVHFNLGASDPWDDEYGDVVFHRVPSADIVYEASPKVPKFIGSYLLGGVLGEGSYAKVKEALDTRNLRRSAVKIMKRKKLRKIPSGEENVKREIRILQQLSKDCHPNIIELFDVHYRPEKEKTYLFLTFCCCSLQDMLDSNEDKKFPFWQAHMYITQTMKGLEYLHSKSVVHKDIKPANLLLDPSHTIRLCDFGVAEKLSPFSLSDQIKGSQGAPMFQSPEIALGKDSFSGFKLDVWSAGVSLYNFVTGNYPYNAENVFKLYKKIGEGEVVIPGYLPQPLQDLLSKMLEYDYTKRLTANECLKTEWITRKHNRTLEEVPIPNDITENSTLTGYLDQLHSSPVTELQSTHVSTPNHITSSDTLSNFEAEPLSTERHFSLPTPTTNILNTEEVVEKAPARSCKLQ